VRVVLIERGPEMGRGLAYARSDYRALLNVPASHMSATTSDPDEFLRFARRNDPRIRGDDFLPRAEYGAYLQDLLRSAAAAAPPGVRLDQIYAEVVGVGEMHRDQPVVLRFADGSHLGADAVVLAVGVPASQLAERIPIESGVPAAAAGTTMSRVGHEGKDAILLLGTGLTMVDVVCATSERLPNATLHAISRHGLLPRGQTLFRRHPPADDGGLVSMSSGSVSRLVKVARRLARELEQNGGDWREVITRIRWEAPALWRRLSMAERGRFLRHVRAYWDVHRHRVPPAALARLEALLGTGRLSVHAGRVVSVAGSPGRARVTWMPRGSLQSRFLDVASIVDCTGLEYDITRAPDRLWRELLRRGLARPDALRLGVRTGHCGALVGSDGAGSNRLFYVGPLLRADYWEATAVGELRLHAERLAGHLAERLPYAAERPAPSAARERAYP